jgi:hypothetical protein
MITTPEGETFEKHLIRFYEAATLKRVQDRKHRLGPCDDSASPNPVRIEACSQSLPRQRFAASVGETKLRQLAMQYSNIIIIINDIIIIYL